MTLIEYHTIFHKYCWFWDKAWWCSCSSL